MRRFMLFFALLLIFNSLSAQTISCDGILGDPIISFDFGQGNSTQDWYSPLSAYAPGLSTNTNFLSQGPLQASNTSGLVKSSAIFGPLTHWLSTTDHTGNPYGLFLGINMPDNIGGIVAEYEMTGLCPNTILQFSIWLVNLMSSHHPLVVAQSTSIQYPNMIMRIVDNAGNIIAQYNTGNVPADDIWHQYAFYFANGNNTNLTFQLINNSLGSGSGNDVGLDDISVRPCVPEALVSPFLDTIICETTTISFTANISSNIFNLPEYQWQYSQNQGATWIDYGAPSASNNMSFTFNTQNGVTSYWIRFKVAPSGMGFNGFCQSTSNISKVRIDNVPQIILSPHDTVICSGDSIVLDAGLSNAASYLWNTGATSPSIVISQSGQYYITVFSEGNCSASDTINVEFKNIPKPDLGPDTLFCEGEPAYRLNVDNAFYDNISWSTGANTNYIDVNESGTYWVKASSEGCNLSDTVSVIYNPIPQVSLGEDFILCEKDEVSLGWTSDLYGASYKWNTGQITNHISITDSGTYWLEVINPPHCMGSDTIHVKLEQCYCDIFIPNAFTPNEDGLNDIFLPQISPYSCPHSEYHFIIFNRYGHTVFSTFDRNEGWNGSFNNQPCDVGAYMYYIKFRESMTGEMKFYKGDVLLLR